MNDTAAAGRGTTPPSGPRAGGTTLLQLRNIHKDFGQLTVLRDISLEVARGRSSRSSAPAVQGRARFCAAATIWRPPHPDSCSSTGPPRSLLLIDRRRQS